MWDFNAVTAQLISIPKQIFPFLSLGHGVAAVS